MKKMRVKKWRSWCNSGAMGVLQRKVKFRSYGDVAKEGATEMRKMITCWES